jgi:hypothetical protein
MSLTRTNLYLRQWEEAVGTLEKIDTNELTLDTGVLELPTETLQKTSLTELISRRVAVLRTDDPDHPYLIREEKN